MLERTNFGKMIAIERVKCDMTASEMAKQLGVTPTFVANVERGIKIMSVSRVAKLLDLLQIEDKEPFLKAYYMERRTIPIEHISDEKRLVVAELLIADLDSSTLKSISELINGK